MNANGLASLSLGCGHDAEADLLVVGCLQDEAPAVGALPPALQAVALDLAGRPGFKGRDKQVAETSVGGGVRALALRGLGPGEELDSVKLRAWLGTLVDAARTSGVTRLAVALPAHAETRGEAAGERVELHLLGATYRFERYLGRPEKREPRVRQVSVVPPPGEEGAYRRSLPFAEAAARGVLLARELGNAPPNEASPSWLEARARELGAAAGMAVEVLDASELAARGMGGILAVGAGSAEKPRLVRLAWGDGGPAVALVGKGITFDTGGISIKPAESMDEMRYDKCGACTALAVAVAAAEWGLPVSLRAYLPIAENMPDGRAYRPGDIVTCHNGKTVEILNTDAEGRMVLADALSLAVEEGAQVLIEYSTLTGACMVALGRQAAGLYTPDDLLAQDLLDAARRTGERLWRLPLWPEFVEQMQGTHADLRNSTGERWGGANTAAAFLSQFVGSLRRWAHLDIAGPASAGKEAPGGAGATGYGAALSLAWLRRLGEG